MNIFEVLSQGKGSINEENISAFLKYLLTPNETHGLKDVFLKDFLKIIDGDLAKNDALQLNDIRLEVPFYNSGNTKKRIIDILLELYDPMNTKAVIIAIENKICENAIQENQLEEEAEYIRSAYEYIYRADKYKPDFYFVFLAPENCESATKGTDFKYLEWSKVIKLLSKIMQKDACCRISPISDYVKQTIKSFIFYMKTLQETTLKYTANFEMYFKGAIHGYCIKLYSDNHAELYEEGVLLRYKTIGVIRAFVEHIYKDKVINKNLNTQQYVALFANYLKSDAEHKCLKKWNKEQKKKLQL